MEQKINNNYSNYVFLLVVSVIEAKRLIYYQLILVYLNLELYVIAVTLTRDHEMSTVPTHSNIYRVYKTYRDN